LTVQFVAIIPPLIQRDIGTADKGKRVVVDLAIKRRKRLVNLSLLSNQLDLSDKPDIRR